MGRPFSDIKAGPHWWILTILSITNMKSNSYKLYTPPCIEVEEVVFESAVLQSSTNSTTQSLDEETYTW